ncbi:unnamed protein product [Ixodes pacificus]
MKNAWKPVEPGYAEFLLHECLTRASTNVALQVHLLMFAGIHRVARFFGMDCGSFALLEKEFTQRALKRRSCQSLGSIEKRATKRVPRRAARYSSYSAVEKPKDSHLRSLHGEQFACRSARLQTHGQVEATPARLAVKRTELAKTEFWTVLLSCCCCGRSITRATGANHEQTFRCVHIVINMGGSINGVLGGKSRHLACNVCT